MIDLRGWARGGMRLGTLALVGSLSIGCPNTEEPTGTSTGGSDGGTGGTVTPTSGGGGAGGAACQPEQEICDGKDNDCNGQIDDVPDLQMACACDDGTTQECYTGAPETSGVGECKKGEQTCVGGTWAECMGQILPANEQCNLKDDDCDGAIDDMGQATCGIGQCAAIVEKCVDGMLQTCIPGQPTTEVCDGIDNDCDQLIDETDPMLGESCMSGAPGVCAQGTYKCSGGALSCTAAPPTAELCDGKDNNCNGAVDDVQGSGNACSTGAVGVCATGVVACQLVGSVYKVDCFSLVTASPEVCDGLDNDCDGQVDEDDPGGGAACDTGLAGACQAGVSHCTGGNAQCVPNKIPVPESCNGLDDDCDGQIDDGNPGGGAACSTGLPGVCAAGTITCQLGQLGCAQDVQPSAEVCGDAIDENCDGVAAPSPTIYFDETFADNSAGWTLAGEWAIGPTLASAATGSCGAGDPAADHTATTDNGVAGAVLGGNISTTLGGPYHLTSPPIDTSAAPALYLEYWRWLHSDSPNNMIDKVEVYDGSAWISVWSNPSGMLVNDTAWTKMSHDVTAHKNAAFQIRFSFQIGSSGALTCSGWNVDDVQLTNAPCN